MKQKLLLVCLGVLAYIPLHALLSTWAISNFGHEHIFKVLKDVVVALTGLTCLVMALQSKLRLSKLEKSLLITLGAFVALHIIWLPFSYSASQATAGLIINLRYLIFFGSLYFLAREIKKDISKGVLKVVLVGAVIVTLMGFLQSTILPKDFLTHFGYGESTIEPYQLVDSDESTVRIIATLRGSNVLGAYMVIVISALTYWTFQKRRSWLDVVFGISVVGLVLFRSYSRAAWLAVGISTLVFSIIHFKTIRKKLLIASSVIVMCLFMVVICFRSSTFIQKTVFHIDPAESSQINSDDNRLESIKRAVTDISEQPLGHGVGSSGIASFYDDKPYVTENYVLEMAYQVGVIGGLLLVAISFLVLKMLYRNLNDPLIVILFSSFVGLTVISLFWPVWSDETVAYTWWGLAGAALGKLSKKQLKL